MVGFYSRVSRYRHHAKILAAKEVLVQLLPQSTTPPQGMMAGGGSLLYMLPH